jgi:hypothetical protein
MIEGCILSILYTAYRSNAKKKNNNMVTPEEAQLPHIPGYLTSDGQHCDMCSLPLK